MSRFGSLHYGEKERQFIGQPVEDIAATNVALLDRYHTNRDLIDQLQIMESNIDLIDDPDDRAVLKQQMDSTNQQLKAVSESGAYEHATNAVRSIYKDFQTNKGLQIAMSSRQQQNQYHEALDQREDLSSEDKGIIKQMMRHEYKGTRFNEESQEWEGGYNTWMPAEAVDSVQLAMEVTNAIKHNRETVGGTWNLDDAETNALFEPYLRKTGITIDSIDESHVGYVVEAYLSNNPKAMAHFRDRATIDFFKEFTSKGLTPNYNDIEGKMFSTYELRHNFKTDKLVKGEGDVDRRDRIKEQYTKEVAERAYNMVKNLRDRYDEEEIDFNMESLMEDVYKQMSVHQQIQSAVDVVSSATAFQRVNVIDDITKNIVNERMYRREEELYGDLYIRFGKGGALQVDTNIAYNHITDINNQLDVQTRKLQNLNEQLKHAEGDDRQRIQDEIYDVQSIINNKKSSKHNAERVIDNLREERDGRLAIRGQLKQALKTLPSIITEHNIKSSKESITEVIEKGLENNLSVEEVKDQLGDLIHRINLDGPALKELQHLHPDAFVAGKDHLDFEGLYELAQRRYRNIINERSKEDPQFVETTIIQAAGHKGVDNMLNFIKDDIRYSLGRFTDLLTGAHLDDDIRKAEDIHVAVGGIVRPGTNELVFHVTGFDEDGNKSHAVISAGDITDSSTISSLLEYLDDFKKSTSVTRAQRQDITGYTNTTRGYIMPATGHANLGSAIQSLQLHTVKDRYSNKDNEIELPNFAGSTQPVKMRIEGTPGRYIVKLITSDKEGKEHIENFNRFTGRATFTSPEHVLEWLPMIEREIYGQ